MCKKNINILTNRGTKYRPTTLKDLHSVEIKVRGMELDNPLRANIHSKNGRSD
jgi:hypothetical protein